MKCVHPNISHEPQVNADGLLTGRIRTTCVDCGVLLVDFDGSAHPDVESQVMQVSDGGAYVLRAVEVK